MRHTAAFLDLCARLLAGGHAVRFRAEGHSMAPAIRGGDLLEIVPVAARDIRVGDVLLCRLGSGSVAHRVVRIDRTPATIRITLRGDAAFADDLPVDAEDVVGRVVIKGSEGSEGSEGSVGSGFRRFRGSRFSLTS